MLPIFCQEFTLSKCCQNPTEHQLNLIQVEVIKTKQPHPTHPIQNLPKLAIRETSNSRRSLATALAQPIIANYYFDDY